MKNSTWLEQIDIAVTVCDREGMILYMNGKATQTFAADGGMSLVGKKLWECHPESARQKIRRLMETGGSNTYTIEKNGIRKLIHQVPWYENGELSGLVELSLVIPQVLPHFIRS
jgi:transcriptional regulator with PAS, ATPase and Fis domain